MKRILAIFLVICLMGTLAAGCTAENPMPSEGYTQVNFNNVLPIRQDFYFFDEGYFYEQDGFYNMGVYWNRGGKSEKLFQESDIEGGLVTFYVHGSDLYFVMRLEEECWLYRYDLKANTYEKLHPMGYPQYMGVLGQELVYQDRTDRALRVLDLETGEDRVVLEGIEVFGLVDGEVRCLIRKDDYEVHRWDPVTRQTEKLGAFSVDGEVPYAFYGFTADHVVMYGSSFGTGGTFLSYALSDGTVTEHTMPRDIHELVAGDNAVFLLVYDSEPNSSNAVSSSENGVYRVDLSDGSCEQVIEEIDDNTEMYVLSDDCICLVQMSIGFLFSANRTAYRYDLTDGTCEKIGTLDVSLWD